MRRELKDQVVADPATGNTIVTRHIPMRRELKGDISDQDNLHRRDVTRHIPMRRELKGYNSLQRHNLPGMSQGISR